MSGSGGHRILIVDDETSARDVVGRALHRAGYTSIVQAASVRGAREALATKGPFALVMLDIRIPDESGMALLDELAPLAPETVVIMVTAAGEWATAVESLKKGAYDFLVKPVDLEAVQLAVGRALKRRQSQLGERSRRQDIEKAVAKRLNALEKMRSGLLQAMCRMAEFRDPEKHAHLERVALYSHLIAQQLAADSAYAPFVTEEFLWNLFEAAPLHDIGKVALPDGILLKPGQLTREETIVMQTHTTVGREICLSVQNGPGARRDGLIKMAAEITGGHHERWDGGGYPGGVKGSHIPLSARIIGLADFYDVCRSGTVYRSEPVPRPKVMALIEALAGGRFDPAVVQAFGRCRDSIVEIEEDPEG